MSAEDRDEVIKNMTRRAIGAVAGLSWSNDYDLIKAMMTVAYDNGFGLDQVMDFAGDRGVPLFGVFRGRYHYTGVGRVQKGYGGGYSCIMVQTTGRFDGIWFFALDSEGYLHTSRDGRGVESFECLDGMDLIQAVVVSALTEEGEPASKSKSGIAGFLSRWFGGNG